MDLTAVFKLLPLLLPMYDQISKLLVGSQSNEDIVSKIANLSQPIAEMMKWAGVVLWPGVNPQLQQAAAIMTNFGHDFVRSAQTTLNIISPLVGLPNPALTVDGINGPLTQKATRAVQDALKAKGAEQLIVDGWYGFDTRNAINAFLAGLGKPPAPAAA
jgi:hypothetical protein